MQISDNPIDRAALLDAYIRRIIDAMDHKDMYQFVYDNLDDSFSNLSETELVAEVEERYPELISKINK